MATMGAPGRQASGQREERERASTEQPGRQASRPPPGGGSREGRDSERREGWDGGESSERRESFGR
jgi:hypothetical protein